MRNTMGLEASPQRNPAALSASTMDLVILCGGRGSRLGALSMHTPKPLLAVAGQPFLLHVLRRMHQEGFPRILLACHYLAEQFTAFLKGMAGALPHMELIVEPEPLGTGGALRHAADYVRSSTFVALNGDSWLEQPLAPVLHMHAQAGRPLTAVVVQAAHVEGGALNKGTWDVGPDGSAKRFTTQTQVTRGWINGGLYVLDRAFVRSWPNGSYNLEAHLPELLKGEAAGVFCSTARLLDIGTPECYAWANHVLASPGAGR